MNFIKIVFICFIALTLYSQDEEKKTIPKLTDSLFDLVDVISPIEAYSCLLVPFLLSFLAGMIFVSFFNKLPAPLFVIMVCALLGEVLTGSQLQFIFQIISSFLGYSLFFFLGRWGYISDSEWSFGFWDGSSGSNDNSSSDSFGGDGGSFGGGGSSDSWGGGDSGGDIGGGDGGD